MHDTATDDATDTARASRITSSPLWNGQPRDQRCSAPAPLCARSSSAEPRGSYLYPDYPGGSTSCA